MSQSLYFTVEKSFLGLIDKMLKITLFILDFNIRSSHPEVFLVKGVLKVFSKFTGKHPCRSVISIKL